MKKTDEQKSMEKDSDFNIDEALDRLEEINRCLAQKDIELKDSLELYREGAELAARCQEHLKGVETALQIINAENEG